jgi:hypothetical protein
MNTNHSNICKFDDETDDNYKVVRGEIQKLIAASLKSPKDKVGTLLELIELRIKAN